MGSLINLTTLSITLNFILAVAAAVILFKAKQRIIAEKIATFSGMLKVIVTSFYSGDRIADTMLALDSILGGVEFDKLDILDAAMLYHLRREGSPTLVDIGGEHVRSLVLQAFGIINGDSASQAAKDANATRMLVRDHFIDQDEDSSLEMLVKSLGDPALASAQLLCEALTMQVYKDALLRSPPTLF